jgi:hypothetical protein
MEAAVIKKAKVFCPYCGEAHVLKLCLRRKLRRWGSREYCVGVYAYYCAFAGEFFMTEAMRRDNEMRERETIHAR